MENNPFNKLQVFQSMYMFFIEQLTALNKINRETAHTNSPAIKLMYIPLLTTCIESVLGEMFEEFIFLNNSKSELESRLLSEFSSRMAKATWKDYVANFELIFGAKMKEVTGEQCYQAIDSLFIFRNRLLHGKSYLHTVENFGEDHVSAKVEGPYINIHQYFLDKKLVSKEDLVNLIFINDKIVNFYCDNLVQFVTAIYENIIVKEQLLMLGLIYSHIISNKDLIHT